VPVRRNECSACGREFRVLERNGEKGRAVCPFCGSHRARHLLPRVAVQFKGGGFYRTKYGRGDGSGPKEAGDTGTATARADDD
jgi:putative FmdB family regulatory protein